MGAKSKIEWTDATFNPWWGCTRVSPACEHCYAETFDKRVHGVGAGHWGPMATRRFFGDKHWSEPLKWNRRAEQLGGRLRVFCASMADVFEDREDLVEPRRRLFGLIEQTPSLDWLLLTKRPENIESLVPYPWSGAPLNIWLGTTAENQEWANRRVPLLVEAATRLRVPVAFLSCEPLLGPIDLQQATGSWRQPLGLPIDWVIAGGESGPGARPMHPDWARSLRDQCQADSVAFHFKQWGEWAPNCLCLDRKPCRTVDRPQPGKMGCMFRCGKERAGRELDGRTWDEFPRVCVESIEGEKQR